MPRPHTTMRQIRDVLRLVLRDNVSRRTAALSLSVPRTSVNDLVTRALAAQITWEVANELDDTQLEARLFHPARKEATRPQPDFTKVKRELAKKGVTLQLLWLEYLEQHPGGYGYSQFCLLYRTWRRHLNVTMRQDHKAAEKLFIDFPGLTIPIYDERTLEVSFEAELFVSVLGASSYLYVEALRSQELIHWVAAHVLVERWIIARLRHRHFTSLGELNDVILDLVERVNDKPFKKMEGSRRSLFEELDRPALHPLPEEPYEFATWKKARVHIDYHVEFARHFYSVPYQLVGQVTFIDALMKSRPHPEQGYRSALGVIRLEKKYGAARLEDACARSLALRAFSYKSVASILQHGLDQQPLRREPPRARVTHHNLRGPNYYQ